MIYSTEQLRNLNLKLETVPETIAANKTRDVEVDMKGYTWVGFRVPDNQKVFFMGQDLKLDSFVFSFYNSENAPVDVKIIKYK
ncbi:hypothetical protein [Priestia megaterium]|uniref:hypothetical protein n=1 Tax=Priestia megaterium TaxID=1404 RepID=UPI000BFCD325|nr:hypothetical protein [Priestia megaterium]PGT76826.1 hypothetical protein COD15_03135 [Priestia megaterium]